MDGLEQRLRDEARTLRCPVPRTLEGRILGATRQAPRPRRWPRQKALAALLVASLGTWWAIGTWSSLTPATDAPTPHRTLSAMRQVTALDVLGETWGHPALGTVEAALLAEVDGWKRDAQEVTRQVLGGIPGPMRRLLPVPN